MVKVVLPPAAEAAEVQEHQETLVLQVLKEDPEEMDQQQILQDHQ